jgi:hypothetical protein
MDTQNTKSRSRRLLQSTPAHALDGKTHRRAGAIGWSATGAFLAGGLLVLWSAYIHFHLWDEAQGYRSISIIGPLFLAQSIGGLLLGVTIITLRRVWVALAGIGYALATGAGFLLTVGLTKGLFNFKETWSAPFASQAFGIEIVVVVVLLVAAALCLIVPAGGPPLSALDALRRRDRPPG